jgi:hypothetical protein
LWASATAAVSVGFWSGPDLSTSLFPSTSARAVVGMPNKPMNPAGAGQVLGLFWVLSFVRLVAAASSGLLRRVALS